MARPLSEEKRLALLDAAAHILAEQGIAAAPTSQIAKHAGVSGGTLFHYFSSKDVLLNELYLHIKTNLCDALTQRYVSTGSFEERFRSLWAAYIDWGVANPVANKAGNQLNLSSVITTETKRRAEALFPEASIVAAFANNGVFAGDAEYADAVFTAIADITMTCAARKPEEADRYKQIGFAALMNMYESP